MEYSTDKLEWLEFDLLERFSHIEHRVFSRHGGTSEGPYTSLNLGNSTADRPDHVKVNRELARKSLGVEQILFPLIEHGNNVARITGKNIAKPPHADAIFTTEKNLGIGVTHADCQAAIFYDPVHEAVGALHAGWKSSVKNIYAAMVGAMHDEIGTDQKDLIVCISPSLGPCHAEFTNYKTELPQEFWDFQESPLHFNFWEISKKQLLETGVLEQNIEIAGTCNYCNKKDYYSHRRDKKTGRNATVVAIKS